MSADLDMTDTPPLQYARESLPWTRVFSWSVRRELWEHRAVYLAPLAVAAFAVFVHFMSVLFIPHEERAAVLADPAKAGEFMGLYDAVGGIIVVAGLLVGVLYSAGALHGERRDRSILFWKSLPVSDRMVVLSKAAIPVLMLPLILVLVVAANTLMLLLQTFAWTLQGFDAGDLWARLDLGSSWLSLLYALPFMALWYAPLHGWLLLVSAWARRWPFLWAAAPFIAMLIVEHLALHQTPAHWMVERYLGGGVMQPYTKGGAGVVWIQGLSDLEPVRLYPLPALWIGVLIAAGLLYGAVRLRRSSVPI